MLAESLELTDEDFLILRKGLEKLRKKDSNIGYEMAIQMGKSLPSSLQAQLKQDLDRIKKDDDIKHEKFINQLVKIEYKLIRLKENMSTPYNYSSEPKGSHTES